MEIIKKKHFTEKFSEAEAEECWTKILAQYEEFLKDLHDFGGHTRLLRDIMKGNVNGNAVI